MDNFHGFCDLRANKIDSVTNSQSYLYQLIETKLKWFTILEIPYDRDHHLEILNESCNSWGRKLSIHPEESENVRIQDTTVVFFDSLPDS